MPARSRESAEEAILLDDHSEDDLHEASQPSHLSEPLHSLHGTLLWLLRQLYLSSPWLSDVGLVMSATVAALVLAYILISNLTRLMAAGSHCQDPYTMHGYLLHNSSAAKARWIPYSNAIIESTFTPATLPRQRDDAVVEYGVLDLAPPSYASMLELGSTKLVQAHAADLALMRNKSVLILGCSLDRFFMESICPRLGAKFVNVMDDWHRIFRCVIPSINLDIQLWFTYGALPEHKTSEESARVNIFEDRIRDHWLPAARRLNLTVEPDMIMWTSGTWDVLGLMTKYREQNKKAWEEKAMSFQELVWHRMRLNQMLSFIRTQWPNVPTLYRPPTFTYRMDLPSWNHQLDGVTEKDIDQINEGVWRLTESAKAVMAANQMPVFAWGEKLIGNNQFKDTTHYRNDSYAQWLYAEMLLYYVHYYSMPHPSHCLSRGPAR